MENSLLTIILQHYYPETSGKVDELLASNKLFKNLTTKVYRKLEETVQQYADLGERMLVLTRMLKAWRNKEYTDVSYTTVFLSVTILLYFVSPIDLIPDFIPLIGGLDDVLLLGFLLKRIDNEIERFLIWENANNVTVSDAQ